MSIFVRSNTSTTERRVVVTGVGVISPLGLTAAETWKNAVEGQSGIARITKFDPTAYDAQIAAEVKGFNPDLYIQKKEQKKMDTFIQYAVGAAQMALQDAGFLTEGQANSAVPRERTGVFVSTGIGGLPGIEDTHSTLTQRGPSRVSPFFIPKVIGNLAAGQIAIQYGFQGPNFCITSACATGAHSVGEAAYYIRRGQMDVMIAGGAEAVVCPLAIGGFGAMKALSTRNSEPKRSSRPFDRDRDGFVLGEGSAVLILEDFEHASRRGAKIYGELTGYGTSCDAYHMTNPAPEGAGAARAMGFALKDARLNTTDIGYINAHGTSTPVGDELETQAVKSIFGSHAKTLSVSSTKSMTGHLLGAAGALESFFSLMVLQEKVIPPTINLENPSEDCDLDYVPHQAKSTTAKHAMNNSFGFGGTNACLIFSKI